MLSIDRKRRFAALVALFMLIGVVITGASFASARAGELRPVKMRTAPS